jgi:hypothetical protein
VGQSLLHTLTWLHTPTPTGIAGVIRQSNFLGGYGGGGAEDGVQAGIVLGNALNAVSTVQAFSLQAALSARYSAAVEGSERARWKRAAGDGAAFGYSQVWYPLAMGGTCCFVRLLLLCVTDRPLPIVRFACLAAC